MKTRIAALGDIHVGENSQGEYQVLFKKIAKEADVFLMCGDLTRHGLTAEAKVLAEELKSCQIPKLAVLGNHDHESNNAEEVRKILIDAQVNFVDDEVYEKHDVGFAGVKGFGGGFGQYMLSYFGESEIKAFVQAALDEANKLEIGLGKLTHIAKKIVLMHYSPVIDTLKGEDPSIFPFLGTTRFEEVIDRFQANMVFHGHAHYGSTEGKTAKNALVYNVAFPLMQRTNPQKPYRIFEI